MRRRKLTVYLTLLILTALICFSPPAWAEPPIRLPNNLQRELSSQTESLRREREKITPQKTEKPVIEIEKEAQKKEVADEGPIFSVKKINLKGVTIFGPDKFSSLTSPFENRQSSFGNLRSLSEVITNMYRAEGYLTSRAYLPPQEVEDGNIQMNVIEGKVGKIFVEGNKYFSSRIYQKYMRFGSKNIFRYQDLETSLYYLNRNPDRKAKAYLIPGEELASSDIILKAKDRNPLHIFYNMSNHGTKLTQPMRYGFHLDHNNLLGFDDSLDASFTMAEQAAFDGGSFSYNFPLENIPVTLSLSGGYVKTQLARHFREFLIRGKSITLSPGMTYSFIQKPALSIEGYAGFDFINSYSLIDNYKSSVDRIRAFKAGPRFTFRDASGQTILNSDIVTGLPNFLNGMEASNDPHASVENAGGAFTFYTINVMRFQRLPSSLFLTARAGGQWSPDTLTSVEQYRAGGSYSVRGYPESDAAGDCGWNASWELSSPANLPKDWIIPFAKKSWKDSLRIVGFLDTAKTYHRERAQQTSVKDKLLIGTGFGFRLDLDDYISGQVDMGFPLGDEPTDKSDRQIHFSMRAGF